MGRDHEAQTSTGTTVVNTALSAAISSFFVSALMLAISEMAHSTLDETRLKKQLP